MIFPIVIEKTTYISYESSMTNRLIIEMFHSCARPLPLPHPLFDIECLAFASKNARRKKEERKKAKGKEREKKGRDK